ncbi:MAG: beta-propeller domain-containing protein, partial [Patescibacteria group bacterium]|nr:beta-propeller domain-containing protein [Patescibacteria group bacterium]
MNEQKLIKLLVLLAIILLVFAAVFTFVVVLPEIKVTPPTNSNQNSDSNQPLNLLPDDIITMEKFKSEQDFKDYLDKSPAGNFFNTRTMATPTMAREELAVGLDAGQANMMKTVDDSAVAQPSRISETNVQVLGIDEPDIVKTDGENIFFSQELPYYYLKEMNVVSDQMMPNTKIMPPRQQSQIQIIKAFPVDKLAQIANIDDAGNILIVNKTLVVLNYNKITAYDVSNPENPKEKWSLKIDERSSIVTSRLYNGKIYLVSSKYLDNYRPCPIIPFTTEEKEITVACSDIYHPVTPIEANVTYTAAVVNTENGQIENKISFVGSANSSTIYMSKNSLYTTYTFTTDIVSFMAKFLKEKMTDLVPAEVIAKIDKIESYDISQNSKMTEFESIFYGYLNSLTQDDQLRIQNEMSNRMTDYLIIHQREIEKTGIVKIDLDNFSIKATGEVPGSPLNQFSLDENNGYLRIATTMGSMMFGNSDQTVSDVNILDNNLKLISSVKDLGKGERIYSVRFVDKMGYVVTFKQIDPFYVLDLSDPKNPHLKGELKIPGFSSYLHPIATNRILGVGREDSKVKISLFDVSDPTNPTEISKYLLDEYWTEVQNSHHAFLQDEKHGVFF